jgi:hypothetical protein
MADKRKVIVHYHIFKNAGTSVDRMLKESLGERWVSWDTPNPGGKISPAEMEAFLLERPQLLAVSSHQVVPPLPDRELKVFPIVFLRHPVDRAYSAWLFEWGKQAGLEKPKGTFDEYVKEKLAQRRKSAIEEFQTLHLANRGYEGRAPAPKLDDEALLDNAKSFVLSLPFVGMVEDYAASLARMQAAFAPHFPQLSFSVHRANAMREEGLSLGAKLREIRAATPPGVYNALVARNQLDLRLYEFASACVALGAKTTRP